ncbi:hypothetical protein HK099_006881, partial [Clydaea vesicula]
HQAVNTYFLKENNFIIDEAEFYGIDFSPKDPITSKSNSVLFSNEEIISPTSTTLNTNTELINKENGSLFLLALNSLAKSLESVTENLLTEKKKKLEITNGDTSINLSDEEEETVEPRMSALKVEKQIPDYKFMDSIYTVDYTDIFPEFLKVEEDGLFCFRIENMKPILLDEEGEDFGTFCINDCYLVLKIETKEDLPPPEHKIWTWIGSEAEMDKRFCCAMFAVGLRDFLNTNTRIQRECHLEESEEFILLFDLSGKLLYRDVSEGTESGLFSAQPKQYCLRLYRVYGKRDIQLLLVEPSLKSLDKPFVYILDFGLEMYQWNGLLSTLTHQTKARMLIQKINKLERVGKAKVEELDQDQESTRFKTLLGDQNSSAHASLQSINRNDLLSPLIEQHLNYEEDITKEVWQTLGELPPILYRVTEDFREDVIDNIVTSSPIPSPPPLPTSDKTDNTSAASKQTSISSKQNSTASLESLPYKKSDFDSKGCFILDCVVEMFLWIGRDANVSVKGSSTELLARIVPLRKRPLWLGLHKIQQGDEPEVFKLRFPDWDSFTDINWQSVRDGDSKLNINLNDTENKIEKKKGSITVDVRALYTPPVVKELNWNAIERTIRHSNFLLKNFSGFVYSKGSFISLPEEERGHFCIGEAYLFLCVYRIDEDVPLRTRASFHEPSSKRSSLLFSIPDVNSAAPSPTSRSVFGEHPSNKQRTRSSSIVLSDTLEINCKDPKRSSYTSQKQSDNTDEPKNNENLECVVYFWQGRRSNRLALTTFKFQTQLEMEELMKEIYGCDVKVVYLDIGRESISLLSHLDNSMVIHSGTRSDFYKQINTVSSPTILSPLSSPNAMSSELQSTSASSINTESMLLYQIWTDNRYKTVRAAQVKLHASSMNNRNCFLLLKPRSTDSNFLFVGREASMEDFESAKQLSNKILSIWGNPLLKGKSKLSPTADSKASSSISISPNFKIDLTLNESFKVVMEEDGNLEEFFKYFPSLDQGYPKQKLNSPLLNIKSKRNSSSFNTTTNKGNINKKTRFLSCNCSLGYFLIEEIQNFVQADLKPNSCCILDGFNGCFIWCGKESSDVVKKLTRKSCQVWLANKNDGRGLGKKRLMLEGFWEGDVRWVFEGKESREFAAYFEGWDEFSTPSTSTSLKL